MPQLKKITRQRIADEVFEALRRAILEREFEPGQRLDVRSLAAELDVSQMPLRQAIQRLSAIGLVEVKPRSGTFVAKVNTRELEETLDVRAALESLAAGTAVEFVTAEDLEELDEILREMEGITKGRHGIDRHDRLNSAFHQRIIEIARNRKLAEIYEELHAHIQIARVHLRSSDWSSRVKREHEEHREILAALAARDAVTLAQCLRDHIQRGKLALLGDLATNAGAA